MARPDTTPDYSDHDSDILPEDSKRSSPSPVLGEFVVWMLSGLWIGGQVVSSFMVYPAVLRALGNVYTFNRHARNPDIMAGLITSYVTFGMNGIALGCGVVLLVISALSILRTMEHQRIRIGITACYAIALCELVWSGNGRLGLIYAPYSQVQHLQQMLSLGTVIQIIAVMIATFLTLRLRSVDAAESGKTKL
jgi:hypothetical protein